MTKFLQPLSMQALMARLVAGEGGASLQTQAALRCRLRLCFVAGAGGASLQTQAALHTSGVRCRLRRKSRRAFARRL